MQRMTFELPDEACVMAFTIVMSGRGYINTFTECHRVVDGQVFTLVDDGDILCLQKKIVRTDESHKNI